MGNRWRRPNANGRANGRSSTAAAATALLLTVALLLTDLGGTRAAALPAGTADAVLATPGDRVAWPAAAARNNARPNPEWVVKPGIIFNHPFKAKKKRNKIHRRIIKTLKNAPAGATVRLATWNFDSPRLARKFIKAHKRGVSVQVIMARGLAKGQGPGRSYPMMKAAFKKSGNKKRAKQLRSWIRTCSATCRGKGGAMHFKFMLVSRSGASQNIIMQGSGNLTGSAAYNQFNDWTTITENPAIYAGWMKVWKQSKKDKNRKPMRFKVGDITSIFAPHKGKSDPALKVLKKVKCQGATNTESGRTVVRVANAVWGDERGVKVARKVRKLAREGCDVRIVFMMMPLKIRNILQNLQAKQMVYITGGTANKFKDRYVHLKGLAVQGNVMGRKDGNVVLSSSENWTRLGWRSDEQNIIFENDVKMTNKYIRWVNKIFRQAPRDIRNYVNSADPQGRPITGRPADDAFLAPGDYPFEDLELE